MTNTIKLAVLAALIASGSAFAQEPNPPTEQPPATETPQAQDESSALPEFVTLDLNQDGAISKDEAAVHVGLTEAFSTSDADQDGKLTAAEYVEAQSRLSK